MLKILWKKFLNLFRRLLGTEQILQQQQQLQLLLQQQLIALGNRQTYLFTDPEKVKTTTTYKRCAEIISLLSPMDVKGGKYVRVGKNHDGGYVMLDNFQKENVDAAYSLGIGNDISWDETIASRGIDVFMFDHTIDRLLKCHPKFHYFRTGVTGCHKGVNLKTLGELIVENGHTTCKNLIMKMDVEGCEWDIFSEAASDVISQFSQFVVEFHGLSPDVHDQKYSSIVNVLKKINQTHQSIHVHGNYLGVPLWIGEFVLPLLLEVTYIRRADVKDNLIVNTRQFPTEIDQPTFADWPDIYLGNFSDDGGFGRK
ncbi:MAG: FkbM family methyltransferase [Candidatus Omnitrophica bacterium]|nr:FkbM family methyltransferase [Candidatus Omnitrophota bacterium]